MGLIIKSLYPWQGFPACDLYYKCFTIVINDSGQYYKTTITIIIDDPS